MLFKGTEFFHNLHVFDAISIS